jgi:hypothetical protein
MTSRIIPATALVWLATWFVLAVSGQTPVAAAEAKFEAMLLWGTDDGKLPEGKDYKPVEPEIAKKLKELPLKWKHYFEVTRKRAEVAAGAAKRIVLSERCELEVKSLAGPNVEVSLIGRGKEVVKQTQGLPKGEVLVLSGNAPDATSWLVVLRRVE